MDALKRLQQFIMVVEDDPRIAPRHIAVYAALTILESSNPGKPIIAIRRELMRMSAIRSRHTYNGTLGELHAAGYINYEPSFYPGRSRVLLIP